MAAKTPQKPLSSKLLAERQRMADDKAGLQNWRRWGPYVSERQWGTVREDYSADGTAWNYLPHEHARSRAYRWGEDGIAGISDDNQRLCVALALWNGRDSILKERLFGLANGEGNHGEDVKELYYYLDATPSHSYLKMLYKYPQGEFPYTQLLEENRRRDASQHEYELLDTGLLDQDRYFDVLVEYAKAGPEDILMRVTAHNRGPESANLWLLPQLWFRNNWAWKPGIAKPSMRLGVNGEVLASHYKLGEYQFSAQMPSGASAIVDAREDASTITSPTLLFCENETNSRRLFGFDHMEGFFKDAFHDYVVQGNQSAVNPNQMGTKAGALYQSKIAAGQSVSIRLRLAKQAQSAESSAWAGFDEIFEQRRKEADEFYGELQWALGDDDSRSVQRQAYAGMIWSKQYFHFDVKVWLKGDPGQPPPPVERRHGRNHDWKHLNTGEIISMPDKWEYPWFAAWDLGFHCLALAEIDPEFAKSQLVLLTREWYMHPNGQLPAYEWAFGDVNPPVHAWAAFRVFQIERRQMRESGSPATGDLEFLERVFQKLLLNFTWWVNRKDEQGRNIFQGGFLGLDNIGAFDRSQPLPGGGFINQADGTSWMAMYCLNMLRIAIELSFHKHVYEDLATKFFEHFLGIAGAINGVGDETLGLWDEQNQFYFDHLSLPDGQSLPLRIFSLVGLIPLLAVEVLEPGMLSKLPEFSKRMEWYLENRPELAALISNWQIRGCGNRRLLSLLRGHRMKALLKLMLDETQFLSEYGIRSVSRHHEQAPFRFQTEGKSYEVKYWPGESQNGLFGGNSNWRGPVWMPINYLLIESLQKFHHYYGDDFKVECPTGSSRYLTIKEIAEELSFRLRRLFLRGEDGRRPVLKYHPKLSGDPHFRDYILFHEYFHGENGRGVGASHQTGWTGLVARLLRPRISGAETEPPIPATPTKRNRKRQSAEKVENPTPPGC